MNGNTTDSIEVAVNQATAWVRVHGRGKFSNALAVRQFGSRMIAAGRARLHVDLADCVSLDSTFIGTLVLLATEGEPRAPVVSLDNLRENVRRQLSDLGVTRLFELGPAADAGAPPTVPQYCPTVSDPAAPRSSAAVLEAHEALVRASSQNEPRFSDVIAFLRSEAAREHHANRPAEAGRR